MSLRLIARALYSMAIFGTYEIKTSDERHR
jgi:hypothetical protein